MKDNDILIKTLGFIGGGNMAEAIIKGLLTRKILSPENIGVSDIAANRLDSMATTYGIRAVADNQSLVKKYDNVILAVKPQACQEALHNISLNRNKLIISIVAGLSIEALRMLIGKESRLIRTMPNTPALALEGMTALTPDASATEEDIVVAQAIFGSIGKTLTIEEKLMDVATAIGGSGPAYVFVMLESLADGGVKMGMPRAMALTFAAQTILGAATLYLQSGTHPAQLKDMVTSPGGTTIAGLHQLELGAFRASLMNAVEAAAKRSKELGA
jgi:pyrroline-5-carboxylate reductase